MSGESGDLQRWLVAGANALEGARARLNDINVFPVADSDTGTNMYLTVCSGNAAVEELGDNPSHAQVVAAFSRGALLGARGNSGVIISQYLTGLLAALDPSRGLKGADAASLARALTRASASAYGAVSIPVEGTMLTVAGKAAQAAAEVAEGGGSASQAIVTAVMDARAALKQTTEQLPQARSAGVIDAGAAGLVLQLEELARVVAGAHALDALTDSDWEIERGSVTPASATQIHVDHDGIGGVYEVMFVAGAGEAESAAGDTTAVLWNELAAQLSAIGDSVAVTGIESLVQAHVHTDSPDEAIAIAASLEAEQILVRNIVAGHGVDHEAPGVLALTHCPGLAAPLADSAAVVLVVPNPSSLTRRELFRAVRDASGTRVVVVAGEPSLRAAATAFSGLKGGPEVEVLDCAHEAQMVAAVTAAALSPNGAGVAQRMREASAACTALTTTADALGADVAGHLDESVSVISLVVPVGVSPAVASAVRLAVAAQAPDAEVVVFEGLHPQGIYVALERDA